MDTVGIPLWVSSSQRGLNSSAPVRKPGISTAAFILVLGWFRKGIWRLLVLFIALWRMVMVSKEVFSFIVEVVGCRL